MPHSDRHPGRAAATAASAPSSWATDRTRCVRISGPFPEGTLLGADKESPAAVATVVGFVEAPEQRLEPPSRRSAGHRVSAARLAGPRDPGNLRLSVMRISPRASGAESRTRRRGGVRRNRLAVEYLPPRGAQDRGFRLSLGRRTQARAAARGLVAKEGVMNVQTRIKPGTGVPSLLRAGRGVRLDTHRRRSRGAGLRCAGATSVAEECREISALYPQDARFRGGSSWAVTGARAASILLIRCPAGWPAHRAVSPPGADRQPLERDDERSTCVIRRRTPIFFGASPHPRADRLADAAFLLTICTWVITTALHLGPVRRSRVSVAGGDPAG